MPHKKVMYTIAIFELLALVDLNRLTSD